MKPVWKWILAIGFISALSLVYIQRLQIRGLYERNDLLQARASTNENISDRPSKQSSAETAEILRLREQVMEVHRLRAEITRMMNDNTMLRTEKTNLGGRIQQLASSLNRKEGNPSEARFAAADLFSNTQRELTAQERSIQLEFIYKEIELRQWWQAFVSYSKEHGGTLPMDSTEALAYLPRGFEPKIDLGNFHSRPPIPQNFAKIEDPKKTVIFRERTGVKLPDGRGAYLYFFADGHAGLFQD